MRPRSNPRNALTTVRAYIALTKPRIIELLLITTVPSMILAADGMPGIWPIVATLIGGTLSAGGANTINCWYDRDIDKVMARTSKRPLPMELVSPNAALAFGIVLEFVAYLWLQATVGWMPAVLAVCACLFYVFVYTMGLKRTSPQNIVIGGAAGAAPVLIGWSAVTGDLGLAPWLLFMVVFMWTPPHFWALAIKYRDDYAAAGVPMLPVVRSFEETARQILLYSVTMVAVTFVFGAVAQMQLVYFGAAIVLGIVFVKLSVDLVRDTTPQRAMRLFHYSITYLGLLFLAVAVDVLVR
ncbi:MAG: heme o synthase [Acidimicrobiia bacterium]|nr:heme o synthase [Acidimicrobiia bacterium]